MQVSSQIGRKEHNHENKNDCDSCGHDHEHTNFRLTTMIAGVVFIANAEGQARVIESGGKTTADRLLSSVEAESKSFSDQKPFYESNPELFQQRLVSETMQNVLTNAVDIFYLSGRQPRIWLNRTPAKAKLTEGQLP